MPNKIAYFLFFLMALLAACGDSGSSSFDEQDQGSGVDSSADGTDLSSGAQDSGSSGKNGSSGISGTSSASSSSKNSSSSKANISPSDTLLYIDKICYEHIDTVHTVYLSFKSDVPPSENLNVYVRYSASAMVYGRSKLYSSVISDRGYLMQNESEDGWYKLRVALRSLNEDIPKEDLAILLASFHMDFYKTDYDRIDNIKVSVIDSLKNGECAKVELYVDPYDSSLVTRYQVVDYFDEAHVAQADTFPTMDSLKKKGCYDTDRNCFPRESHYILELGAYVHCSSGCCYEKDKKEEYCPAATKMPIEGSFTDPRDGTVYPTVVIGMFEWFAKNLEYSDSVNTPNLAGHSWCYNDDEMYCEKFGRLYDWAGALNLPEAYNDSALWAWEWYQGICPEGWHVSTGDEFSSIWQYTASYFSYDWIYTMRDSDIWDALKSTKYNNLTGFSAMPGGFRTEDGLYKNVGTSGRFLTTAQHNAIIDNGSPSSNTAWLAKNDETNGFNESGSKKRAASYIRCVKGAGVADARPHVTR